MEAIRDIIHRYSTKSINIIVIMLVFLGNWPLQDNEQNLYLCHIRFLPYLALSGNTAHILNAIYDISLKLNDYELLSEAIIILILSIKAFIRLAFGTFRTKGIEKMVSDLDEFTLKMIDKHENEIFHRYKQGAKLFTILFVSISVGFGCVFAMEPLTSVTRTFPAHTNFPFKRALDSPVYEIMFVLVVLESIEISTCAALGDVFFFSAMMCVTAQYKILQYKLEHLREHAVKEVEEMKQRKIVPTLFEEASRDAPWVYKESELQNSYGTGTSLVDICELQHTTDIESQLDEILIHGETSVMSSTLEEDNATSRSVESPGMFLVEGGRGQSRRELETTEQQGGNFSRLNRQSESEDRKARMKRKGKRVMNCCLLATRLKEKATLAKRRAEDKRDVDLVMKKYLGEIVQSHQALIRFTDLIQENFNYPMFFELLVNSLMVAVDLLQIASVPSVFKLCLWICFLLIHVVEIFSQCWCVSEVEKESANLVDALYFSDWLESPASYKRSILIMMSRAVQPIQLRGASFLPLNMEVFANIMNSAYSYYGAVRQMNGVK